jgi:hypothetical protein
LHPELKTGLEKAGFDIRQWSDRHLLTVQIAAATIVNGNKFLFVEPKMKPMVTWVVENIYGFDA